MCIFRKTEMFLCATVIVSLMCLSCSSEKNLAREDEQPLSPKNSQTDKHTSPEVLTSCVYHVKDGIDLDNKLSEAGDKLVALYFFTAICDSCEAVVPKFEELCTVETNVVFLKVDTNKCENLPDDYKFIHPPTFMLMKQRNVMDCFTKVGGLEKLRKKLHSLN
ncbi:thioredoxin domain-containing protein 2-like [Planococcus citri]|uniref:thioredoxin domain-containing protein 2-like n=1 Tax=Planococcus citri TaxID=170843 RepID=UPI0031F98EE6